MKSVYIAETALDAQLIHDQLVDEGYQVFISGLQLSGALGELPLDATPEVKVIDDEQYLPARALVEEILLHRESYNVISGSCSSCGEAAEQGFSQCWNCGTIYSDNQLAPQLESVLLKKLGLQLSIALNTDSDAILALINNVLSVYSLKMDMSGIDADLLAIESNYHKNDAILWVVKDVDEKIIAVTAVKALSNNVAEIRKMYIDKNYRSKRLGRLLLDKAIRWCCQKQFTKITLETASILKPAIALYLQNGFKEISACSDANRCDKKFELKI